MARFTSIGMPKKTFVASAAEEAQSYDTSEAGPSKSGQGNGGGDQGPAQPPAKKRKRRGTRGKVIPEGGAASAQPEQKKGWGRDPSLAKRTKLSADHAVQRREKRQHNRDSGTTCFACRSVGHAARDCPNVLLALEKGVEGVEGAAAMLGDGEAKTKPEENGQKRGMKRKQGKKGGDVVGGKCYRCNGTDHSLGACPEPVDPTNPTPYATCFICLGTGHLSSLCPSNQGRGIYVNGGSCKVCQSTAHRAKDCPEEAELRRQEAASRPRRGEIILGSAAATGQMGADEDDFMVDSRENMRDMSNGKKKGKGKREKHLPNNNGVRGLYMGKKAETEESPLDQPGPVAQAGAEVDAPAPPVTVAKPKKKVVAF